MDTSPIERALADVNAMLPGSGQLSLRRIARRDSLIEMDLDLDGVDCVDCVVPPSTLHDVVANSLRAHGVEDATLLILDPRVTAPNEPVLASAAWITVLDPSGRPMTGNPDPGPALGDLRGKRIGFRLDVLWECWDMTVAEWTAELERAGATVVTQRRRHGLTGAEGVRALEHYHEFVADLDAIVSGLGNCGSCTSWMLKDGLAGFDHDICAAIVVTEEFERLACTLATGEGHSAIRTVVLPHSLHHLTPDDVRAAARRAYRVLLDVLGAKAG